MGDMLRGVLNIAGLGVSLTTDSDQLANHWQRRYQGFLGEGVGEMAVEVRWQRSAPGAGSALPGMTIEDGQVRLGGRGFAGVIDFAARTAQLELQTADPGQDTDYFLRVIYALLAFRRGGILMHGAGILRGEKGYLFFGHSGSGKTTVSRLSVDAVVLNDDLVVLREDGNGWTMDATPFWNPTQVHPTPVSCRLSALFRLVQAKRVETAPMSQGVALAELIACTPVIPDFTGHRAELFERWTRLLQQTPAYYLRFLPDASFWPAAEAVAG